MAAAQTGVPLWYLETGNWRKNEEMYKKVRDYQENFKGKYKSEIQYEIGDVVEYEGTNYTVIEPVKGIAPPDSTYYKFADRLRDIMSTYEKEMHITEAVQDQAEADAPRSGYDTTKLFTIPNKN